jgi:hypothetical protein
MWESFSPTILSRWAFFSSSEQLGASEQDPHSWVDSHFPFSFIGSPSLKVTKVS